MLDDPRVLAIVSRATRQRKRGMIRIVMVFAAMLSLVGTAAATPIVDFSSGSGAGGGTAAYAYTFSPGGTFNIVGALPVTGIGKTVLVFGTLGSTTHGESGERHGLPFNGAATLNTALMDRLEMQAENISEIGALHRSLGRGRGRGNEFTELPIATDVGLTPIPEPASLALLGTGLVGLAGWMRRRSRQRHT